MVEDKKQEMPAKYLHLVAGIICICLAICVLIGIVSYVPSEWTLLGMKTAVFNLSFGIFAMVLNFAVGSYHILSVLRSTAVEEA